MASPCPVKLTIHSQTEQVTEIGLDAVISQRYINLYMIITVNQHYVVQTTEVKYGSGFHLCHALAPLIVVVIDR